MTAAMMATAPAVLTALLLLAGIAYAGHAIIGRRWIGRVATGALALTWLGWTGLLVWRGVRSGHWPLGNRYAFSLCFLWIMGAIYLGVERAGRDRRAGVYAIALMLALAMQVALAPDEARALPPLPPVLRSPWLQAHVLACMVGYGFFGIAAALALLRLVHWGDDGALSAPEATSSSTRRAEAMMCRLVALGMPWLTLGLLTGALWAHLAWGRYWGWDPKETWALITWFWHLMVLHLRPLPRWRGKKLAWLVLVGFGLVLFTFIGVPQWAAWLQIETLHGY